MSKYSTYFALYKSLEKLQQMPSREELIATYTDDEKTSLTELSSNEYAGLLVWMRETFITETANSKKDWQSSSENQMRRKIIAIFIHQMGYDMKRLDGWCLKHGGFKKKLNDHLKPELIQLVNQAERVYADYVKNF